MYLLDRQPGMELPMPPLPPDPDLGLEVEDDHLVVTRFPHCLGQDFGTLHMALTHHHIVVAGDKKNPVQLNFAARLGCQALNFDDLSWGDSVLLPSGLNYCVNGFPPIRDAN